MRRVASALAKQVAVKTAPWSIPAASIMAGCTNHDVAHGQKGGGAGEGLARIWWNLRRGPERRNAFIGN